MDSVSSETVKAAIFIVPLMNLMSKILLFVLFLNFTPASCSSVAEFMAIVLPSTVLTDLLLVILANGEVQIRCNRPRR